MEEGDEDIHSVDDLSHDASYQVGGFVEEQKALLIIRHVTSSIHRTSLRMGLQAGQIRNGN